MPNVLIVVAAVTAAYLFAHKVFERLRERFLVATGAVYILVGLLLGPHVPWSPVLHDQVLAQLTPVMSLAVGWVGLLYGMNANIRRMVENHSGAGVLAIKEGLVTVVMVGAGAWAVLRAGWLGSNSPDQVEIAVWALATTAAVGNTDVIDLVRRRFRSGGRLTSLLDSASRLGELLAIIGFGLLYCFHHPDTHGALAGWDYANWILVTLGLGLGLGVLFRLFLGRERDPDKQFLALLGIVVFASGAAHVAQLSPLLVNLLLGVVLANVAPNAEQVVATLQRYHRAMIILLLVFAGTLWRPVPMVGLAVAAGYVALRVGGKLLGGRWGASGLGLRRDLGRGLLGHGEVAVAMALGFRLVYQGPLVDMVFTAVLVSVLLGELWSTRAARALLLDAGEIQPESTEVA